MTKSFKYNLQFLPEILEVLKKELRIAVVYGGNKNLENAVLNKTHNTRDWKSYYEVAQDIQLTLREIGFEHVDLMADDMNFPKEIKDRKIHMAWLNTAGVQGLNAMAHTASVLELLGIPYLGHDPLNYALLDHKLAFKWALSGMNIKTPPFVVWDPMQWAGVVLKTDRDFRKIFGDYDGPFVVKPVNGRASRNIYTPTTDYQLNQALRKVHAITYNTVLIEKFIPGREFCIAIAPPLIHKEDQFQKLRKPFTFSIVERIIPEKDLIFTSLDQIPISHQRAKLVDVEKEPELSQALTDIAETIYKNLGLRFLARIDIRQDEDGSLYVLEANPKPDLKRPTDEKTSLVAMGLDHCGMSYHDLICGLFGSKLDMWLTYLPFSAQKIFDILDRSGVILERNQALSPL